jgi:hypothetical protein
MIELEELCFDDPHRLATPLLSINLLEAPAVLEILDGNGGLIDTR